MANLGHITSTAINGADAPVFEKAGVEAVIAAVENKDTEIEKRLAAQAKQITDLTGLLSQFLASQVPTAPAEAEAPKELTPQEKANATKAAKKAAEEAAKAGE